MLELPDDLAAVADGFLPTWRKCPDMAKLLGVRLAGGGGGSLPHDVPKVLEKFANTNFADGLAGVPDCAHAGCVVRLRLCEREILAPTDTQRCLGTGEPNVEKAELLLPVL